MTAPLRILLVEDNPDDELLIRREIRKSQDVETVRVETRDAYITALDRGGWDLIISDYYLPSFGGMEALAILRDRGADIPFILVSGTIGEEIAVESIKAGADDYLLKQNLIRLAPAVTRAIREAENRRARRATEQSLRESRERLELIFNTVSDILVFLTRSGDDRWVYTSANRAFTDALARLGLAVEPGTLFGRDAHEIESQAFGLAPEAQVWLQAQRREVLQTRRPVRAEHSFVLPGGSFIGEFTHIPICDPDDPCRHILISCRDVTELRRAEQHERNVRDQMIQTQKMESLGRLSSGIAHDFNNILTAILGFAQLTATATNVRQATEFAQQIVQAAGRAKELVRQILLFSRRQPTVRESLLLTDLVREVLALAAASFPKAIEMRSALPTPGPRVFVDPGQLHQVILNLCTNAAQAMPSGGRLTLAVTEVELDESFCHEHVPLIPGRFARLTVSDTGTGMTPEVLRRAFEPFFTIKAPGEGTGLGLSVVHTIIREHQGTITVASTPGKGTTFDIYLPMTTIDLNPTERERAVPFGRGQRVLCVDDDPAIVHIAAEMLIELGYRPTSFTAPVAALAAFDRDPTGFDVVVTDNRMASMSGITLARAVRKRRPDVPLLLATGTVDPDELEPFRMLGVAIILSKPYTRSQLADALARLLKLSNGDSTDRVK